MTSLILGGHTFSLVVRRSPELCVGSQDQLRTERGRPTTFKSQIWVLRDQTIAAFSFLTWFCLGIKSGSSQGWLLDLHLGTTLGGAQGILWDAEIKARLAMCRHPPYYTIVPSTTRCCSPTIKRKKEKNYSLCHRRNKDSYAIFGLLFVCGPAPVVFWHYS